MPRRCLGPAEVFRPWTSTRRIPAALLKAFCSVLAGVTLLATEPPLVPIESLAVRADVIVHGRVESVETLETQEGRRLTRVELVPISIWKGAGTNRLGLVLGSGVLGERWVKVLGEPEYTPGEEVVVFAVNNDRGEAVTVELAQGKFKVSRPEGSPGSWVSNGHWGGVPESREGSARLPHQLPLGLEQLRDRVRKALAEREAGS